VTITDAAGHTGTLNCSVNVAPPVSATCVSIVAVQGNRDHAGDDGWQRRPGRTTPLRRQDFAAGLSISASGRSPATATVSGTFNYTVTVTDAAGTPGH